MNEPIEKQYDRSLGYIMQFAGCLGVSAYFAWGYWSITSAKAGESVSLLRPAAFVFEQGGTAAFLVVALIFAAVSTVLLVMRIQSKSSLKQTFGADAFDKIELEKSREYAEKQGLIGKAPAHHASLEAFQAYKRRLRIIFSVMFVVFSLVGVAAVFGII